MLDDNTLNRLCADDFERSFDNMSEYVNNVAASAGWNDSPANVGELLMLVVTELAEATEELRKPIADRSKVIDAWAVEEEIADAVIRLMHLSKRMNWDVGGAIVKKARYNETRSYRHGGKKF